MSPRHVPAGITELSRIGIFGSLPGEVLERLARELHRETIAAGASFDPGDGFVVVLSGVVSLPGTVLRPGGQAGVDGSPGPLRAVMPSVVAWCGREVFETHVRPYLAA
jgi:hypothetical protein